MFTSKISLPKITLEKDSFLDVLNRRFSCRNFRDTPLSTKEISLLLWSTNGLKIDATTEATRILPSAGATYPLEIFLVVGNGGVEGVEEGVYRYDYSTHSLWRIKSGDVRRQLTFACLNQNFILQAPVSIAICAQYERTTSFYGQRGYRYVIMEAGHACQNLYLICSYLHLGTVEVGAFEDEKVKKVLGIPEELGVLSIMPVGKIK